MNSSIFFNYYFRQRHIRLTYSPAPTGIAEELTHALHPEYQKYAIDSPFNV